MNYMSPGERRRAKTIGQPRDSRREFEESKLNRQRVIASSINQLFRTLRELDAPNSKIIEVCRPISAFGLFLIDKDKILNGLGNNSKSNDKYVVDRVTQGWRVGGIIHNEGVSNTQSKIEGDVSSPSYNGPGIVTIEGQIFAGGSEIHEFDGYSVSSRAYKGDVGQLSVAKKADVVLALCSVTGQNWMNLK